MITESITIDKADLRRLLASASGDAALLYLYIRGGGESAGAEKALSFSETRFSCAAATLRQQLTNYLRESSAVRAPGDDYRRAGQMDFRDYDENDEEF